MSHTHTHTQHNVISIITNTSCPCNKDLGLKRDVYGIGKYLILVFTKIMYKRRLHIIQRIWG